MTLSFLNWKQIDSILESRMNTKKKDFLSICPKVWKLSYQTDEIWDAETNMETVCSLFDKIEIFNQK